MKIMINILKNIENPIVAEGYFIIKTDGEENPTEIISITTINGVRFRTSLNLNPKRFLFGFMEDDMYREISDEIVRADGMSDKRLRTLIGDLICYSTEYLVEDILDAITLLTGNKFPDVTINE